MNKFKSTFISSCLILSLVPLAHAQAQSIDESLAQSIQAETQFQLENFARQQNLSTKGNQIDIRIGSNGWTATIALFDSQTNIDLIAGHDLAVSYIAPSKSINFDISEGFYTIRVIQNRSGKQEFQVLNENGRIVNITPAKVTLDILGDQAISADSEQATAFIEINGNSDTSSIRAGDSISINPTMHGRAWGGGQHGDFWFRPD